MFDVEPHALNEHEDPPAREEDSFDPQAAEEELATLSSHLDAATYRQLVLIRQLDDSGHWVNDARRDARRVSVPPADLR